MSRRQLSLPSIALDLASAVPLQRQIGRAIAKAIREHAVPAGSRLPSSRILAKLLGVSRNTVLAAYDELAAEGLVCGERGAGMRVEGVPVPGMSLYGLRQVIRDSGYPARTVECADPDGNPFYLRFGS